METRLAFRAPQGSRTLDALTPGLLFTLMTSLLFTGCAPGPDSTQPPPSEAGLAVANSQGTPTSTKTAPLPSGTSMPAATPVGTLAPAIEPALVTPRQRLAEVPESAGKPAPPEVAAPEPTVAKSTPNPHPQATTPAPSASPATPTAQAPRVVSIGGLVEVAATKPGLTRIGSVKCKLCHKPQFDSWAKTAHATRSPPLDCESCHGAGSEYKSLAIMKDSRKAQAAGLVMPARSFCAKCHTSGWSDDLLKRTHAHKAGS